MSKQELRPLLITAAYMGHRFAQPPSPYVRDFDSIEEMIDDCFSQELEKEKVNNLSEREKKEPQEVELSEEERKDLARELRHAENDAEILDILSPYKITKHP